MPRRPTWLSLLATTLVLFWAAIGAAQTWQGAWDTTYGRLELTQEGAAVTGTYTYGGGSTVTGTADGATLTFTYTEPAAAGEGVFTMSDDGARFEGQWRESGGGAWYAWTGTRVDAGDASWNLPTAEAGGSGFEGLFETTYGRLRLWREGDEVTGHYSYAGGSSVEGTLEGDRLVFRYTEPGAAGEGWFELSDDGNAFNGMWREDGGTQWTAWTGTRVTAEPGVFWLVVLEAQWENSLAEQEYAFGEMLEAYFARFPNVRVRHRRLNDREDFVREAAGVGYLAEPTAVLLASHGSMGQLTINGDEISADDVGALVVGAPNVFMLHVSSCEVMQGGTPARVLELVPEGRSFALSGYAVAVDWSASALLEFLLLDLVLGRGYTPMAAAAAVRAELSFASDMAQPTSPLGGTSFRMEVR